MKRLLAAVLLTSFWLCQAAAQFEGIVETRNLTTDELGNLQKFMMTMWIKKDRIRVQNTAYGMTPATTMIYRNDRRVIWMLNEDERTYLEILQEEKPQGPGPGLEDTPKVRRPGRTKRILGYVCEQIVLARADGETEIWGTKQLADLGATTSRVLGQSGAEGGGWMDEIARLGLYPLISTTRIEGKVVESQETTRIEVKNLDPVLFELPPDYRKQAMGEMQEVPHD